MRERDLQIKYVEDLATQFDTKSEEQQGQLSNQCAIIYGNLPPEVKKQ
jgi:hypothetical protein